jgi:hypothetical protein
LFSSKHFMYLCCSCTRRARDAQHSARAWCNSVLIEYLQRGVHLRIVSGAWYMFTCLHSWKWSSGNTPFSGALACKPRDPPKAPPALIYDQICDAILSYLLKVSLGPRWPDSCAPQNPKSATGNSNKLLPYFVCSASCGEVRARSLRLRACGSRGSSALARVCRKAASGC